MTIKEVLAQMTDAEVRTWLEEAYAEEFASYSRDEMVEELIRLAREGCEGLEQVAEREGRAGLEREFLGYFDAESTEDPADEQQIAEDILVWLQETRSGQ